MRLLMISFLFAALSLARDRVPVVVELFTSEGCSSCPSADDLLAELERRQPVAGVDVIALSEHVDYWNSGGWKDPFSTQAFSERQQAYARRSGSGDIYTPEAIIDGHYAMVGSSRQSVLNALTAEGDVPKPALAASVQRDGDSVLIKMPLAGPGERWVALTQAKAVSHVEHGENSGRTLQHVGVVRLLTKMNGEQTRLTIKKDWQGDLRVVVFVQDARTGRILQAIQKGI